MEENKRITKEYRDILSQHFDNTPSFGRGGKSTFMIAKFLEKYKIDKFIDYGCGRGRNKLRFGGAVRKIVSYDPAIERFRNPPKQPEDGVICMDVMEHIEEECLDSVLEHIASLTAFRAMFYIALSPAKNILPDGRNAHINLKTEVEWINRLDKYFHIVEVQMRNYPAKTGLYYVGKPRKT